MADGPATLLIMRAQYHFRKSPQGLCAWNVHRLVERSYSFPRERLPLSAIRELDEAYWSGDGDQQLTCRDVVDHARLMLDCDLTFPVILSSDGRDASSLQSSFARI